MFEKNLNEAAKAAAKKLYDFDPGLSEIEFTLHAKGTVSKSEDVRKVVPQAACFQTLFAAALSKLNGCTAKAIGDLVSEVMEMTEAERKSLRDSAKQQTQEVMRGIGVETEKVVSGPTRFVELDVEVHHAETNGSQAEDIALLVKQMAG